MSAFTEICEELTSKGYEYIPYRGWVRRDELPPRDPRTIYEFTMTPPVIPQPEETP